MAIDFERQVPLLDFIVDFYCPEVRLVIEIDGEHHYGDAEQRRRDAVRTRRLGKELGLTVLRFSNDDVRSQFPYVIYKIADVIAARLKDGSEE